MTIAINFGTGTFDPLTASGATFTGLGRAIFDVLLEYDDEDKLVPGIAERWEIAPDGMSQTFYIRKGVKFHNGDDLTAADVKFSIERMMGPKSVHQDVNVWKGVIDKIELKDDYTLIFRMKVPQFDQIKSVDGGMTGVLPKKYFEERGEDFFFRNPIGSGPWKVVKYEPGLRAELEALDSHWRAVPQFKNIILIGAKEEASLVAMLKTGELDLALVSTDSVPGLKAAGIRIVTFDRGTSYYSWPFYDVDNPTAVPLGDVRVRKALQLAINSKEMADKLFSGNAAPQIMTYVRPTAYFWDSNVLK
ncbi:MAG: ABC transporter substrate-binding protein, partial [Dehalococcoidia bacterium]|nr:ABC transporter substrate-binding protein [Dehalococcoidia bacterium]